MILLQDACQDDVKKLAFDLAQFPFVQNVLDDVPARLRYAFRKFVQALCFSVVSQLPFRSVALHFHFLIARLAGIALKHCLVAAVGLMAVLDLVGDH